MHSSRAREAERAFGRSNILPLRPRPRGRLSPVLGLVMLVVCGSGSPSSSNREAAESQSPPFAVDWAEAGWTLTVARQMPEQVTALVATPNQKGQGEFVFAGTGPVGGVYRFYSIPAQTPKTTTTIAVGRGDRMQFGICNVSGLAVHDLDRDGTNELLAQTSQIQPEGRPRLYVWSLTSPEILRGFARPDIESSWSHGLGFSALDCTDPVRVISTFCGHGEVVEYALARATSPDGFQQEALAWRVVGHMPVSGEGTQTADVDNDRQLDVCLATGYAAGRAAIHVYDITDQGIAANPKQVLDEDLRFGTVKFLVGSFEEGGPQDMIAWWCTGLGDGFAEIFHYQLEPSGVAERVHIASGNSETIWPLDGQMTFADMNRDGRSEVWFATPAGYLWRYDPSAVERLAQVCRIPAGLGPIAPGTVTTGSPSLYVGADRWVLQLQPEVSAP